MTRRREAKVSAVTVRKVMLTLGLVMKYAVKHQLAPFNPVASAERLKSRGKIDGVKKQ